jgi:hypothetical protein
MANNVLSLKDFEFSLSQEAIFSIHVNDGNHGEGIERAGQAIAESLKRYKMEKELFPQTTAKQTQGA